MKFPINAIWHNADYDQPVILTGIMGELDGVVYYTTNIGKSGIPSTQLTIEHKSFWRKLFGL